LQPNYAYHFHTKIPKKDFGANFVLFCLKNSFVCIALLFFVITTAQKTPSTLFVSEGIHIEGLDSIQTAYLDTPAKPASATSVYIKNEILFASHGDLSGALLVFEPNNTTSKPNYQLQKRITQKTTVACARTILSLFATNGSTHSFFDTNQLFCIASNKIEHYQKFNPIAIVSKVFLFPISTRTLPFNDLTCYALQKEEHSLYFSRPPPFI
jgi:hypothetical protein